MDLEDADNHFEIVTLHTLYQVVERLKQRYAKVDLLANALELGGRRLGSLLRHVDQRVLEAEAGA